MQQANTWQFIFDNIENGIPVMLLYVLESHGSSPGRQGFFMAVTKNFEMEGSIGGGIMEHKFVEMARKRLDEEHPVEKKGVYKQVHDKEAVRNQSGMICSGEQTILLLPLYQKDLPSIHELLLSLRKNENGTFILSPAGLAFENTPPATNFQYLFTSEADWIYREKTGYRNRISIIGGGHCSLALSALMRKLGFYVTVYEDRQELKTFLQNKDAHARHIVKSYSELKELVQPAANHFVVIMTFGYRTDDIAIRSLEGKEFSYIGVLGSSTKISKMIEAYRQEGMNENWLQQLYAPIGIQIRSQTPEEIAVSIAAQIIQVKNKEAP